MPLATSAASHGSPLYKLKHFVAILLSRIAASVLREHMSAVHRRWAGRAVWWTCSGSCPKITSAPPAKAQGSPDSMAAQFVGWGRSLGSCWHSTNVSKYKSRELWCRQILTGATLTVQWDPSLCAVPFLEATLPVRFCRIVWGEVNIWISLLGRYEKARESWDVMMLQLDTSFM